VSTAIPDAAKLTPICRKYGVKSLAVFGSYARNEAGPDSDMDLLVSFAVRIGLLRMVWLERELSELIGRKVDLQTEAALSPYIRDQILEERQIIYAAS
jgi:predicted nucleotidyltransferase